MTPINEILGIAVANFCYVGLRAFQQLNVVHNARTAVFFTSYLMALGDIFLVSRYAQHGVSWILCLTVGTSAALGCLASMEARKRWLK